jgi:hypothetical protein
MSFVGSNIIAGASGQGGSGYAIERSLRFNSGDSAYLSRNFAAGNRKKWTWSGWFKLSKLGQRNYIFTNWNSSGQLSLYFEWTNSDKIRIGEYSSSAWEWQLDSTSQFRDSSAWYHLVAAVDTTQSTASDRVKVYINGEQLTSFSPSNYPSQNKDTYVNQAVEHNIGRLQTAEADFYLADVHFIDGQALAPTDFGETDDNGVWQPKEFEGNYVSTYSGTTTSLSQTGWNPSQSGNIWDGNASSASRATGYAGGTKGTVSFYPPLTNVIKVEVWTQNYVNYLNGASVSTPESINGGWHTFYDNSGSPITLNSVGNAYDTNNTQTVDIAGIRINGSIVDSQTWTPPSGVGLGDSGANSFHLPFSDNSSNAALGTDTSGNSNTWTVNNLSVQDYIQYSPSSVRVDSAHLAFDGSTSTYAYSQDISQYSKLANFTFSNVSTFEIYSSEGADWSVKLNGGTAQTTSAAVGWRTISNPPSTVTSFEWQPSDGSGNLNAFRVNGVIIQNDSGAGNDSLVDTPTNGTASTGGDLGGVTVGNYATFNPLDAWSSMSFSNGNLQMTDSGNGGDRGGFLTIGPTADKFYWEITFTAVAGENYIGLAKKGRTQSSSDIWSGGGDAYMYYSNGNKLGQGNGGGGQSYGASFGQLMMLWE